jgi:urease accessory protein
MTRHPPHHAIAFAAAILLLIAACAPVFAHTGSMRGGFVGGFAHPLFGPDHVVAMVAVGLWGAFLGAPAIWLLPIVFPLVMAGGGVIGILGIPLPGVEIGIAISAIVLGLMVMLAAKPPLLIAAVLVGAFAIFHGYAHGAELPPERTRLPIPSVRRRDRTAAPDRHCLRPRRALAGRPHCRARRVAPSRSPASSF